VLSTSDPKHPALPEKLWPFLLAALLLCLHAWMALSAASEKSAVADEMAYLCSGHVYWEHADYRLHPENGILIQRWEGLPGYLLGWKLPDPANPAWATADVWALGTDYFHNLGNPLDEMLFWGRLTNIFWSVATGLLVFAWSRRFFGNAGGLTSLVLYAFCPSFLAHGALATSDLVMSFFFLASTGAFWKSLRSPGWGWTLGSSLLFGLACVAKFSSVLLLPIFGLLGLAHVAIAGPNRDAAGERLLRRPQRLLVLASLHALCAIFIIWLFYGFRWSPEGAGLPPLEHYYLSWDEVRTQLGGKGELLWTLSQWHLLPDPFIFGFGTVLTMAEARGAFLNGDNSITGWFQFFPYAFLVKTPHAFLAVLLVSGAAFLRKGLCSRLRRWTPLLVLLAAYWAVSVSSNLNIGHRHLLPVYPPLFIASGWLGAWAMRSALPARFACLALLALQIGESLNIRPHYLSYFNLLAGGPSEGYKHLVDSSLDWGQDLPALASWLSEHRHPGEAVFLSYAGTDRPSRFGFPHHTLPSIPSLNPVESRAPLTAGLYCIGATMLQRAMGPLQGPWSLERENAYLELKRHEALFYISPSSFDQPGRGLSEEDRQHWRYTWKAFNNLRFERLCQYLRVRTPDAQAGFSILIYRLSEEEVAAATGRNFSALLDAMEKAQNH